ncbi:MAG: hypothetical protein K2I94_04010, partial [Muribaculaceae bacterium]|nr:hypothetical protein [Muribaculaceae bacterium]
IEGCRYNNYIVNIDNFKINDKIFNDRIGEKNAFLYKGLNRVFEVVGKWCEEHPNSQPPIVIHISEFGYNGVDDYDLLSLGSDIKSICTTNGNTKIFNIIYSDNSNSKVVFPSDINELKDYKFGEMYYLLSSIIPLNTNKRVRSDEYKYRTGLIFKCDISEIEGYLRDMIEYL